MQQKIYLNNELKISSKMAVTDLKILVEVKHIKLWSNPRILMETRQFHVIDINVDLKPL